MNGHPIIPRYSIYLSSSKSVRATSVLLPSPWLLLLHTYVVVGAMAEARTYCAGKLNAHTGDTDTQNDMARHLPHYQFKN